MPGFHLENFGCRAARADGEAISARLLALGHCVQEPVEADVVVVNTCSVTEEADRAARAFIRKAHRQNPSARIVVTGCYAQRSPEELARMEGVSAVVGNSHKALAPEIVLSLSQPAATASDSNVSTPLVPVHSLLASGQGVPIWADDRFAHSFLEEAQLVPGERTRPNLKIQEGCGNRCTFCVIPYTRGASKSLPAASVVRQIEDFVTAGGKELVLSGINLGRWGHDLPGRATLPALVREILTHTALPRLRLSSIEPMDWNDELMGVMGEFGGRRLARHAHLPLQSGSDAVLRRMHRRYRPWHYVEKAEALIRAAGPDLTLGADVMVGFPGETEAEFEETVAMIRALPIGYLHLFPFSPRPGTPGQTLHMQYPVPQAMVEERMAVLRAVAIEQSRAHRARFIGRTLDAITLHTPSPLAAQGHSSGLTENFLPVNISGAIAANRLVNLRIGALDGEGILQATESSQA